MADKSVQLILGALGQAAACAEGLPLFTTKAVPGLFPNNAAGKQAAQRGIEDGFLSLRAPGYTTADAKAAGAKKTKAAAETYVLTEKGFTFFCQQVSPRQVLEDLVRVLEQRQCAVAELLQSARQMQTGLDTLRTCVEKVLQPLQASLGDKGPGGLANLLRSFRQEGSGTPATGSSAPTPVASAPGVPATDANAILEAIRAQLTRWQTTSAHPRIAHCRSCIARPRDGCPG